jgi:DNA adenine methylase
MRVWEHDPNEERRCEEPTPAKTIPAAKPLAPLLKWHGGKSYLAERIVALMPPHTHYAEPYFGGGAVLLAKDPNGVSECVNDVDGQLTNFWRVLQHPERFTRFQRIVEAVPFSELEWNDARDRLGSTTSKIGRAVLFFILCRQSLAGRMDAFAPLSRTRTRRRMNEQASAWLTAVEGLAAVHDRLKRVAILNRPALQVIEGQDGPGTLFYCDPPYLHSTRTARDTYGPHEMAERDHAKLLEALKQAQAKAMISGYRSDLYDLRLADWRRHDFELPNNAAAGARKRRMIECLWTNF